MPHTGTGVRAEMEGVLADIEHSQRLVGLFAMPLRGIASGMIKLDARLDHLEAKVDDGFAAVNQRFEQVDKQLEQVDRRFEQVDRRLDSIDLRMGVMGDDIRAVRAHVETVVGYIKREELPDERRARAPKALG